MSIKLDSKRIEVLRKEIIEQLAREVPTLTVEHLKLAEMRVQTAIMAAQFDVDTERNERDKKK